MEVIKTRNQKLAEEVAKNLRTRHFEAYVANSIDEARDIALVLSPRTT